MTKRKEMKRLGREAARACGARWRRCIARWHDYIESLVGLRSWVRLKREHKVSPGVRLYQELVRKGDVGVNDASEFWETICWDVCPVELDESGRPRVFMEACRDSHDFIIAFVEELVAKETRLKCKREAR